MDGVVRYERTLLIAYNTKVYVANIFRFDIRTNQI